METITFQDQPAHRWSIGPSTFIATPARGARLLSWTLRTARQERSVIHWPDDADWNRAEKVRGGNPILFPFCGRCFDKGQIGLWRDNEGTVRPMPQHGFARDGVFTLEKISEAGFTARLVPDEAAREAYPFDYAFRICYAFDDLSMRITMSLENKGEKPLPWSAGHHFYFTLPWHPGTDRHDYTLELSSRKAFYHGPDGKLQPDKNLNSLLAFDDPRHVDRVRLGLKRSQVCFGLKNDEERVTITFEDRDPPSPDAALVTWTETEDAPYYCVEPWMGPPNAPGLGKGLHWVNPGETEDFTVSVSLL